MIEELIKRIGQAECWIRDLQENGTGSGITLPSGGDDGDVLVKSGSGLVWGNPSSGGGMVISTNTIIVTTDGQDLFLNAIPAGKSIFSVSVEGVPQIYNVDYQMEGTSLRWISSDPEDLSAGYIIRVIYY